MYQLLETPSPFAVSVAKIGLCRMTNISTVNCIGVHLPALSLCRKKSKWMERRRSRSMECSSSICPNLIKIAKPNLGSKETRCPQQELDLHFSLRTGMLYPLSYGGKHVENITRNLKKTDILL